MRMRTRTGSMLTAVLACGVCTLLVTPGAAMAALRVCADPGNLPLSNNRGEGFENKIAAVLAKAMDTTVENYFRPGIERGLTRSTLDADQCDVEPAEIGERGDVWTKRRADERRRIGERPLAGLSGRENLRCDRCEFRIEDVAALGVRILAAQGFELVFVHACFPNDCQRLGAEFSASDDRE